MDVRIIMNEFRYKVGYTQRYTVGSVAHRQSVRIEVLYQNTNPLSFLSDKQPTI